MTALSIQPPFPIITDIDGQPLEDGYIWIGTAGLNPIGNPISVYWDAALSVPAALPVRTRGGYPMRSGTPARLYVDSDYSLLVQNKNGSTVYSALTATERLSGVVVEVDATDVAFIQAGTGAVTRTAQAKMRDTVSVKDFGALGDYAADDTAAIQAAFNSGLNVYFPPGLYIVTNTITVPISGRRIFHGAGSNNSTIYFRPPAANRNAFSLADGDNIEFRDLGFILQFPLAEITCFSIGNPANSIRWRRCEFTYWNKAAIRHDTAEYDVIEDCRFISCTDTTNTQRADAIRFGTYANTTTIRGCRFSGNDTNMYVGASSALRIENCSFEGNGNTANTVAYGSITKIYNASGLTFSGNYVEGEKPAATYGAIELSACQGAIFSGNTFSGDFGGVDITDTFLYFTDDCVNVTLENNKFNNPKDFVARWYLSTKVI